MNRVQGEKKRSNKYEIRDANLKLLAEDYTPAKRLETLKNIQYHLATPRFIQRDELLVNETGNGTDESLIV